MTEDQDRLEHQVSENSTDQMQNSRRAFIQKCMAVGGGMIVYFTPKANAYAAQKQLSPGTPVFDVTLPADYDVAGQRSTLSFSVPGAGTANVEFDMNGQLRLQASGTPDVADCSIGSLDLTSVSPTPLASVGVDCGRLTGQISAQPVGQLNLMTGEYTPRPNLPLAATSACGSFAASVQVLSGGVQSSACAPAKAFADCNCLNGNDVDLTIPVTPGIPDGTTVGGLVQMCVTPRP